MQKYNSTLFQKCYVFDDERNNEIHYANLQNQKHFKIIFFLCDSFT